MSGTASGNDSGPRRVDNADWGPKVSAERGGMACPAQHEIAPKQLADGSFNTLAKNKLTTAGSGGVLHGRRLRQGRLRQRAGRQRHRPHHRQRPATEAVAGTRGARAPGHRCGHPLPVGWQTVWPDGVVVCACGRSRETPLRLHWPQERHSWRPRTARAESCGPALAVRGRAMLASAGSGRGSPAASAGGTATGPRTGRAFGPRTSVAYRRTSSPWPDGLP